MRRRSLFRIAACWAVVSVAPAATGDALPGPDVLVRNTAEQVLEVIRGEPELASGNMSRLGTIVETYLVDHFDFARMTRLAVGKNWRAIDDTRKASLVREFQTLLIRTYSIALAEYRDQKIEYKPLTLAPGAREAVVATEVVPSSGKPISMNYRMALTESGWKVYDVVVDGVSLVINYRSLFNSTVENSGVDGLIEMLREKNAGS